MKNKYEKLFDEFLDLREISAILNRIGLKTQWKS